MFKEMVKDHTDKISSKRFAGMVWSTVGGILIIGTWVVSSFTGMKDPGTAMEAGKVLFFGGLGVLGFNVFELLKK